MKYSQSDPHFLLLVLQRVHNKAGKLEGIEELCSLAETLALLKEALRTADTPKEDITRTAKIKLEVNEKDKELTEDTSADNENSSQSPEFVVVLIENELVKICDELLNFISHSSRGVVKTATTSELRRLLAVYSLLPFRADDLINEIEKEIDARLSTPDSQPWITVEKRLRDAKERSESLQRKLFHETESSGLTVLKNGFMSLFGSSEDNESAEKNLSDELIEMIRASINSTIEAATSLQEMKETLDVSIDSIGQQNMEKKYFELGRCQELIANYRRIEFSTGSRRSRYDKERRKDISKRVLHRLLP